MVSGFYTFLCLLMAILLPPVGVVMRIGVGKVKPPTDTRRRAMDCCAHGAVCMCTLDSLAYA